MKFSHAFMPALALAGAAVLAGCGPSVESSQAFQEQAAQVKKLEASLKQTSTKLTLMSNEFQTVSNDVNRLVAAGPGGGASPDQVHALEMRVAALESSMKGLNENLVAMNGKMDRAPRESVRAALPAGNDDAAVAEANSPDAGQDAPKAVKPASKSEKRGGLVLTARRRSGRAARSRHSSDGSSVASASGGSGAGQYHLIQPGETLDKIARRYHTTASDILSANRIPSGRKLMAGQQIFVPNS